MYSFGCRFDQLWGRFEPPDESNRWDSPLFRVDGDAPEAEQRELFQHLAASLLDGKRPKPAASTTKVPALFLFECHLHVGAFAEITSMPRAAALLKSRLRCPSPTPPN